MAKVSNDATNGLHKVICDKVRYKVVQVMTDNKHIKCEGVQKADVNGSEMRRGKSRHSILVSVIPYTRYRVADHRLFIYLLLILPTISKQYYFGPPRRKIYHDSSPAVLQS